MSLIEIKRYMMQVRVSTLSNLCNFFKVEPEMVRCMLQHWMKKGNIRQCVKKPACGSKCFKCPTATSEIYEWVDTHSACV